jgi:hypothetical protein
MPEDRHEYLAKRVQDDLRRASDLLFDSLLNVVLDNQDVHVVPWHDEAALTRVADRLSTIVNGWGASVKQRVEDSLSGPSI